MVNASFDSLQNTSADWSQDYVPDDRPKNAHERSLSLVDHDSLIVRSKQLRWLTNNTIRRVRNEMEFSRIERQSAISRTFGFPDPFVRGHYQDSPSTFLNMSSVSHADRWQGLDDVNTATLLDSGVLGGIFSGQGRTDLNDSAISDIIDADLPSTPKYSRGRTHIPSRIRMDWVCDTPPKSVESLKKYHYDPALITKEVSVADATSRRAEIERNVIYLKSMPPAFSLREKRQLRTPGSSPAPRRADTLEHHVSHFA